MSFQGASDEFLVERVAAQRDMEAFSALYDRYSKLVYVWAAHILDTGEAEDVVQEVFLRLWHKAHQFDPSRGRFNVWLMAVTRHRVLDLLHRRSQQQRMMVGEKIEQVLAGLADPGADPEEQAWMHQCGDGVREALCSLPAEQRQALVLAYFGGLSQSAMAQHLHWPLGTVKKRIRLGLQKLRGALAQQGLLAGSHSQPGKARVK